MSRRTTDSWGTTESARAFFAASGAVLVAVLAGCSSGGSLLVNPAPALNSAVADTHAPANAPQRDTTDSTDSSESSSTRQDAPPAFHFESGDIVLGDFVYEDVKGNIFNPCEEISAEEFAAIGFESSGTIHDRLPKGLVGCVLQPLGARINTTVVVGGPSNQDATLRDKTLNEEDASTVVPGVYTFVDEKVSGDFCSAAVDTKRGQFGATVGSISSADTTEELCEQAVAVLDALY